jgi:hypothetical protein
METNSAIALAAAGRPASIKWLICGTALASLVTGSLLTAHVTHANQAKASSNRVFELLVYHTAAFPQYRKRAAEVLEKVNDSYRVDDVYMHPTDYSAMK